MQRRSSARRARRRARTTGCRRATGTTPSHYDPGDSSRHQRRRRLGVRLSEAGAGHTVPTLDSIQRFLSPLEQDQLWQNPDYNQYHANYEPDLPGPDNGGYSFGTLHDLDAAISNRYGAWSSLSQYVQEAQVQNYETQRAEFEAYIDHSTNKDAPSTGIVYWQLNKGWPTLLWDLYNNDFDQAGSYFGAKKANEPLHVLYAYDDGTVSVDNLGKRDRHGLSVVSNVYGVDGNAARPPDRVERRRSPARASRNNVLHPAVPAATTPPAPAKTYFVELLLERHGKVVDRNVYWLSTQQDLVDWDKTIGNPQATMTQFANLTALQSLPAAAVRVRARTESLSRRRREDRGADHQHLRPADGRVLPASRCQARDRVGSAGGRRQRGAADLLVRQRRHAVAGGVADAAGHLPPSGPPRRLAGRQRVGVELGATGRAGLLTSASS